MTFLYFIVGYCALYLVIWLHEVGHGIAYAKYKCKDNPFNVQVPFYLFFSTPMPIHEIRAESLNSKQFFHVGIAGIIVNLIFGIPIALVLLLIDYNTSILVFFLYSFALFHLVEAATYLTISNIFLSSDMIAIQNFKPGLRVPLFILGTSVIVLIVIMLMNSPDNWTIGFIISITILVLSMAIGRLIFSLKANVK